LKKGCCYECVAPKRHPGCHAHCEEYIAEKKERDKRREEIYAIKEKIVDLNTYYFDRGDRVKKHFGRK
jgi:hypothetical protein